MAQNKIRQLEDNLIFRHVAESDRPSNIEDMETVLLRNQERAMKESHELHGTIGPDPNYDEKGNIIPQELWAPDLSFTPIINKKSLKTLSKKMSPKEIGSTIYKKLPSKIKNWLSDTNPTESILTSIDYAKKSARKNIYSLKGFDRFLDTVEGGDIVKNAPTKRKMNLYKAWKNLIKNRIAGAEIHKMSLLERWEKPFRRGYATGGDPANVSIMSTKNIPAQTSTAVHEITHTGQLNVASHKTGAELDHIANQYGVHKNDMQWLANKLSGANSRWELGYMEKIKPYLKQGFNITDPNVGQKIPRGKKGYWDEYALQPLEISARMSQIRDLESKVNPTSMEARLLKHLRSEESKFFDKEGIDYAVNKLWMTAPAIPMGLDEDLFKEVEE